MSYDRQVSDRQAGDHYDRALIPIYSIIHLEKSIFLKRIERHEKIFRPFRNEFGLLPLRAYMPTSKV